MTAIQRRLRAIRERRLVLQFLHTRSERAFRRLYRHHTPRLFQLVLRLLQGNQAEAQEVVQETWIRAVERLEQFRWQSSLGTWLTGIAIHRCQEQFRHRRRDHRRVALDAESLHAHPAGSQERLDLEKAIAGLADGYRQVLVLHDLQGYTHDEIADMLDIKPGTSKSQLSHARERVRARLRGIPDRETPHDT